jgi:choline kinase
LSELTAHGVRDVVLVVGYKQDMIREAVAAAARDITIRYLVNDQFQRGSISSLWLARTELDGDVVVMDADVLFHAEILRRLVSSSHPTAVLMDETVAQQTEECMVVVRGGRVVALTKRMPSQYDFAGEGVGFLKVRGADCPALIRSLQGYVDQGRWAMEYEDGLLEFFADVRVGFERIGGLPWTEIDFPDDIVRAEREILPKLESSWSR